MEATTVRLWYKRDTPSGKARVYSRLPKSRCIPESAGEVLVPMSIIEHTSKFPGKDGDWPEHHVKLPDWFVTKEHL